MGAGGRIWVDHRNAVLRRGIVSCLQGASVAVAGVSSGLDPVPELAGVTVLLFELDGTRLDRTVAIARGRGARLVGLLGESGPHRLQELQLMGLSAVLGTAALRPARLIACVHAVQQLPGPPPLAPRMFVGSSPHDAPGFAPREVDVLRLLADGASTRDIAERMNYSERTVKNIVHGIMVKLRGRTRAQAVAVAARRGVI
jgi:DNA-binding NarL/FixJ family response regulator